VGSSVAVQVLLAVVAPLAAAVLWGTFVAPKASRHVSEPVRLAIELAIFALATAALFDAGHPRPAVAFAVLAVANGILVRLLDGPLP
jgi:hypothetical protein